MTCSLRTVVSRLLLVAAIALSGASEAANREALSDQIDGFVREEMRRQKAPGVAIAVIQRGAVLRVQAYGLANVEHRVTVGPGTVFQAGSLAKQFTAAAVMVLVEDGKLSLDDRITKFFSDAPQAWRAITVRHLLTHTSGIPDYEDGKLDYRKDYSDAELTRFAFGLPLEFAPGTRWSYSNTAYVLLGFIIQRASGAFYGDVLAERVFKPLGMTTARVISEADIVPHRAAGYRLKAGALKNQEWVSPSLNSTADGSMYVSIQDLIAWDAAVRGRRVLKPASWELMLEPVRLASRRTYPYGFGWFLHQRNEHPYQHHSGSWQGFTAHYSRFIGDDLSVIVLTNLAGAKPARLVDGIAEIINPKLAAPVLRPIEDRDQTLTVRSTQLLEDARSGKVAPSDFAYMRAGLSEKAEALRDQLTAFGPAQKLVLLRRIERGDDRISTYEVTFESRVMTYEVGFAPDYRISVLELRDK